MKNSKNILFVVNPISGNTNKKILINVVQEELKRRELSLLLYMTTGKDDATKIRQLLEANTIDRVFIAGGDGTIKMVAETLINNPIPFAIFPAGSANGLALNFKLPDSTEEQLEIALGSDTTTMDVVKINGETCLHLADFGINAELIENYEKSALRGKMGYLLQSIPTLIKSDYPFHFEFETDEGHFSKEGLVLAIANCQQYGTGAIINPSGSMNDGKFELILFKSLHLGEIIKTLTNQTDLDPEFAETFPTTTAKIKCRDEVPFQIDGEFYGKQKELHVSIINNALSVFVP